VRGRNYPRLARWIAGGSGLLFNEGENRRLAGKDKNNWHKRQRKEELSQHGFLWVRSQWQQVPSRETAENLIRRRTKIPASRNPQLLILDVRSAAIVTIP
jgi:hypothetical protein